MSSSIFDSLYGSYGTAGGYSGTSASRYDSYLDRKSAYSSSPYSSSYSSGYASNYSSRIPSSAYTPGFSSSVYDKYYNYLDDLSTIGRYSGGRLGSTKSTTSSSSSSYVPSSAPFKSRFLQSSSSDPKDEEDKRKIGYGVPSYDKFGKELTNYDKWKLSQQGADDSSSTSTLPSLDLLEKQPRKRFSVRFSDRDLSPAKEDELGTMVSGLGTYSSRYGRSASLVPSISSTSKATLGSSSATLRGLPSGVADKLSGYDVKDVRGDGGCYYRCLSLYFTGSEDSYMKYRREVLAYIRDNLDNYSTMIRSEMGRSSSTSDYFSRKMRADRQDWAETTEIIATCCVYDINVHVLALVPGRRATWEWLHFDPSIGTGKPSCASRDVYLYNQGSVHFMLCTPR